MGFFALCREMEKHPLPLRIGKQSLKEKSGAKPQRGIVKADQAADIEPGIAVIPWTKAVFF